MLRQSHCCILGVFVKTKVTVLMVLPGLFGRELSYCVSFADDNMNIVNTPCLPRYAHWRRV